MLIFLIFFFLLLCCLSTTVFKFQADVTYVDGSPASGIRTKIQAVADNGKKLFIAVSSAQSDENGKVSFEIQPELHHKSVTITVSGLLRVFFNYKIPIAYKKYRLRNICGQTIL